MQDVEDMILIHLKKIDTQQAKRSFGTRPFFLGIEYDGLSPL